MNIFFQSVLEQVALRCSADMCLPCLVKRHRGTLAAALATHHVRHFPGSLLAQACVWQLVLVLMAYKYETTRRPWAQIRICAEHRHCL